MDFVILSEGRSGTNMLRDYLDKQKNIKTYGEIFHKRNGVYFKENLWKTPDLLLETPLDYTRKNFYGFKLLYRQLEVLEKEHNFCFLNYAKEKKIKIIILTRKNSFLRFLSFQKAQQTNRFIITKLILKKEPDIIKKANKKITFDINAYRNSINYNEKMRAKNNAFIVQNNITYKEFFYEDLIGENKHSFYKDITTFIGETEENFNQIDELDLFKQNIYKLEDQILNFNEVKDTLKNDLCFQEALMLEV